MVSPDLMHNTGTSVGASPTQPHGPTLAANRRVSTAFFNHIVPPGSGFSPDQQALTLLGAFARRGSLLYLRLYNARHKTSQYCTLALVLKCGLSSLKKIYYFYKAL